MSKGDAVVMIISALPIVIISVALAIRLVRGAR